MERKLVDCTPDISMTTREHNRIVLSTCRSNQSLIHNADTMPEIKTTATIWSNNPDSKHVERIVRDNASHYVGWRDRVRCSRNFFARLLAMNTLPESALQASMRIARRRRMLRSLRFWYMLGSFATLLTVGVLYSLRYMPVSWRRTRTKTVRKVSLSNVPDFDLIAHGSNDVSNYYNLRTSGHEVHVPEIATWMFGYSTRPVKQSSDTVRRQRHVLKNREKKRTKHVLVNFLARDLPTSREIETNTSSILDDIEEDNVQDAHKNPNPAIYGWTPSTYPNPRLDPLRCGISYIVDGHRYAKMSQNNYEFSVQGSPTEDAVNGNESSPSFSHNNDMYESTPLRLCDPDWMLGGLLLEEVAASMYNFSDIFSQEDEGEKPWDVAVGRTNTARNFVREWFESIASVITQAFRWENNPGSDSGLNPLPPQGKTYEQVVSTTARVLPPVELAVATVRKMNLLSVLRQGSYYAYEDQDDMVSDAAQIFARSLHDVWWSTGSNSTGTNDREQSHRPADYGILLFLSIQDRICFISTGSAVQHVLPWWRLDHIVASMKPDLRHQQYGTSVVAAIHDLANMLLAGPPSFSDRLHDFVTRFGVVIAFAGFTFVFGAWGEYRDRRKRWQYAEQRSKLTEVEREKALQLQKEFKTRSCPICLESFDYGESKEIDTTEHELMKTSSDESAAILSDARNPGDSLRSSGLISYTATTLILQSYGRSSSTVDKYGVPLRGADGKKIKILRCGHIFCENCWKGWVHSGCGNPCNCPVCRQDVGKAAKNKLASRRNPRSNEDSEVAHMISHDGDDHASSQSSESPYGDINNSNDTVDDHFTDDLNPRASIALDMPLVGGGASFLLSYAGLASGSNANHIHIETEEDGENTPLLASNNSSPIENYTTISQDNRGNQ